MAPRKSSIEQLVVEFRSNVAHFVDVPIRPKLNKNLPEFRTRNTVERLGIIYAHLKAHDSRPHYFSDPEQEIWGVADPAVRAMGRVACLSLESVADKPASLSRFLTITSPKLSSERLKICRELVTFEEVQSAVDWAASPQTAIDAFDTISSLTDAEVHDIQYPGSRR